MNQEIWSRWQNWGPAEVIDGSGIAWWGNSPDGTDVCRTHDGREWRMVDGPRTANCGEWSQILCPDLGVHDLLRRRGVLLADLEYERLADVRISMRRAICRINVEILARRGYVYEVCHE